MPETCDVLYLSPHLDDVALSCGGQIARRSRAGERVVVLTIFAADEPTELTSPLARQLHYAFGLERGVLAARRAEDVEACRRLGAVAVHWEEPEAVYRDDPETGDALYPRMAKLFAQLHEADEARLEALARRFAALEVAGPVFAPLGVGGHVDHLLVRGAAEAAFPGRLTHYEDYPYVETWGTLRQALGRKKDWIAEVAPIEDEDLGAKIAACAAYESQVEPLFGSVAMMERRLGIFRRRVGGERLWRHC